MKRLFIIIFALLPMMLYAGIIVKKSGEQLTDITIKSVTDNEIIYKNSNGKSITISKSEVSAILYDDGRYEEIKQPIKLEEDYSTPSMSTEENKNFSQKEESKKTNDAIQSQSSPKTDKRIIPQACYTEANNVYKVVYKEHYEKALNQGYSKSQAYKIAGDAAQEAKLKSIDECYNWIVVEGHDYEPKTIEENTKEQNVQEQSSRKPAKKMIPKDCYLEGNQVYKDVYQETQEKALRQGYSKSQSYKIASEAAMEAKQKAIDDCYNKVVGEENN